MLNIKLFKNDKYFLVIEFNGHCTNNYGKDLVCAGVSAIIVGFCNFLIKEKITQDVKIKIDDGYCLIQFIKINSKIKGCLEMFYEQILTIYRENKNVINIEGDIYEII